MAGVEVTDLLGSSPEADIDELADRAALRDAEGHNHLEVARIDELYPMLTVYIHDDCAVVFRIDREGGGVYVLKGDNSTPISRIIRFRSPIGYEEYSGQVIVKTSTAIQCLRLFAMNTAWPSDFSWISQ